MAAIRPRYIVLIAGIVLCAVAISLVMIKGNPRDMANFDSVAEIGEGALHSVAKVGQIITSISDSDEMEVGKRIHEKILKSRVAAWANDTPLDVYVNKVGSKVAENVKRKSIKYVFHIIENPIPNAFSIPGGHVYVTTGLLAALKTEAELAAVLAHEVAHIDAKHCIGTVQYKVKLEKISGVTLDTLADIGYSIFLRPAYSEVQETESDAGAVYLLYAAGYHPMALVSAFERIDKHAVPNGYNSASATPVGDTVKAALGMVNRYFATHPAAIYRIDKVKKYIADNKLINENSRFYIGQENYKERVSYSEKRYKDEFRRDYPAIEDKTERADAPKKEAAVPAIADMGEGLVNEVYTGNGRIVRGMAVEEVEKMLPKEQQAFKYETRMGYKNIMVYDLDKGAQGVKAGLWIELDKGKVRGIKLMR